MGLSTYNRKITYERSNIWRSFCHSEYLGRKIREVKCFDWNNVDLIEIVGKTRYPEPKTKG